MADALINLPLSRFQNLAQPFNTQISAFADSTLSSFRWAENYLNSLLHFWT